MTEKPRPGEYCVDDTFISTDEARHYLGGLSGRERVNHRRIQAWFDHCARIRAHPASMITAGFAGIGCLAEVDGVHAR